MNKSWKLKDWKQLPNESPPPAFEVGKKLSESRHTLFHSGIFQVLVYLLDLNCSPLLVNSRTSRNPPKSEPVLGWTFVLISRSYLDTGSSLMPILQQPYVCVPQMQSQEFSQTSQTAMYFGLRFKNTFLRLQLLYPSLAQHYGYGCY